jgi:hypothetical protein
MRVLEGFRAAQVQLWPIIVERGQIFSVAAFSKPLAVLGGRQSPAWSEFTSSMSVQEPDRYRAAAVKSLMKYPDMHGPSGMPVCLFAM